MKQGYIAIVSLLVITGVLVVLGITATLAGIGGIQTSQSKVYAAKALNGVEACAEEALIHLQDIPSLPSTVTTPLLTCTVTVNAQTGTSWDFTVTGTLHNYTKNIRIQAERNDTISISSWGEMP